MNANVATAIAALPSELEGALLGGHDTRAIRRRMSELAQRQRHEEAERAAAERQARAEQEAAEAAAIEARAAALAAEVEARIEGLLASMPLPPPMAARRFPDGTVQIASED